MSRGGQEKTRRADAWRSSHPRRPFHEFYAEHLRNKVSGGTSRKLGPRLALDSWRAARRLLRDLVARGLRPGDTVVDYGCGTLRVGRFLIDHLEPDRYWGLEVAPWMLDQGRALLAPDAVAGKRPRLRVIDAAVLADLRKARPDWVVSFGVLQHVPPEELESVVASLLSIAWRKTRIVATVKIADRAVRSSWITWARPESVLRDAIERAGGTLVDVREKRTPERHSERGIRNVSLEVRMLRDPAF